ncbi:hypothetical protein [Methylobacterium sp. A54F]
MTDGEVPAKKGGRPRLYPGTEKRPTLTFRVRGDMHQRLQESAQAEGRSLSEEIEHRLHKSFYEKELIDLVRDVSWKNAVDTWSEFRANAVGGQLNDQVGFVFASILGSLQNHSDNAGGDRNWTRDRIKALVEEKGASEMIPALLAQFPFPGPADGTPHPDEARRQEAIERSRVTHERKGMQPEQD